MLSCRELVAHASDYIDAQMGLRQRWSVRMHLAMCINCRRFVRQLRLTRRVLRQLPRGQSAELDALAAKLAELRRQQR